MPINEDAYTYGGARALVELHDQHLRAFVRAWTGAVAKGVELPAAAAEHMSSLAAMLRHVLGAARHYMVWICENLLLPTPAIDPVPDDVEERLDAYLEHQLAGWDGPLYDLDEKTADRAMFDSSWGVAYCIDAMLEHAVMHPIRHTLQLRRA